MYSHNGIFISNKTQLYIPKKYMNLKVILNENSQTKQSTCYVIPSILNFTKCNVIYGDRKHISGCLGMVVQVRISVMVYKVSLGTFESHKMFILLIVEMISWMYMYVQIYQVFIL